LSEADFKTFLDILLSAKERYGFNVHSLCLMPNHYHLLIETIDENLSLIARQINSKYAQYFNRVYKRVGPLWQGRFKNWYVYDEKYLYNLFRYIEQNPLKAKIAKKIGDYPWSASTFMLKSEYKELWEDSQLIGLLKTGFLDKKLNVIELEQLDVLHRTVYKSSDSKAVRQKQTSLKGHFNDFKDRTQRNEKILEAVKDGYMQSEIAHHLKMTAANVSKIISKYKSGKK